MTLVAVEQDPVQSVYAFNLLKKQPDDIWPNVSGCRDQVGTYKLLILSWCPARASGEVIEIQAPQCIKVVLACVL